MAAAVSFRRAVAVVASLLSPGAGHLLFGMTRRGAAWALAGVLIPFPVLLLDSLQSTTLITAILLVTLVTGLAVQIGAAIDAARIRLGGSTLPSWKRVALSVVVLITVVAGFGVLLDPWDGVRERYLQAYVLPAGSMYPTLLPGDHFLVNKFIYRFQKPARGDVVVFKYPVDENRDFVKRVIGVGGEDIYIKDRHVFVNCRPPEPSCQPIKDPWGYYGERVGVGGETFGPVHVPPDSYFVMGDNRNNSQDSRYWGFVKRDKIKGRAFLIYWSWDSDRHWLRWWRLGRYIP